MQQREAEKYITHSTREIRRIQERRTERIYAFNEWVVNNHVKQKTKRKKYKYDITCLEWLILWQQQPNADGPVCECVCVCSAQNE